MACDLDLKEFFANFRLLLHILELCLTNLGRMGW